MEHALFLKKFRLFFLFAFAPFLRPASLCTSASPYHEVMRMERRLRSSSEGAGGPRVHGNHRDASGTEGCGLLKHRNDSSSSKLGSLVSVRGCLALFKRRIKRDNPGTSRTISLTPPIRENTETYILAEWAWLNSVFLYSSTLCHIVVYQ